MRMKLKFEIELELGCSRFVVVLFYYKNTGVE